MQFLLKIVVLHILVFFCGCKQREKQEYAQITFGICCGECVGDCFQGFIVTKDTVYKVSGSYCDKINTSKKTAISEEEAKKIKSILEKLPPNYAEFSGRLGCPDCHDQCGIYLHHSRNGSRYLIIDPDKTEHPKEFDEFISAVQRLSLL